MSHTAETTNMLDISLKCILYVCVVFCCVQPEQDQPQSAGPPAFPSASFCCELLCTHAEVTFSCKIPT